MTNLINFPASNELTTKETDIINRVMRAAAGDELVSFPYSHDAPATGEGFKASAQSQAEEIPVARFEVGKTYTCRSACDYNTVFEYTVIARTAKRITIEDKHGNTQKRGVYMYGATEQCKPEGTYSMCPVISAE